MSDTPLITTTGYGAVIPGCPEAVSAISSFLIMARPSGFMCLVAIKPDSRMITGKTFDMPVEADEGGTWATAQNAAGYDIYWTVNPVSRRIDKKPTKADIVAVEYAHADIDPDVESSPYTEARAALLGERYEGLYANGHAPTFTIDSGNGIAPFWRVKGVPSIEAGEDINKRIMQVYNSDPVTWNIDRIMRLPDTFNYPNKKKISKGYPVDPTHAKVLYKSDLSYGYEELCDALPPYVEKKTKESAGKVSRRTALVEFNEDETLLSEQEQDALMDRFGFDRKCDRRLAARWEGGTDRLTDRSRSGLDMSLGAMLRKRSYTYRETRSLLINFKYGAGAEKILDGDERYFRRIWMRSDLEPSGTVETYDAVLDAISEAVSDLATGGKLGAKAVDVFIERLSGCEPSKSEIAEAAAQLARHSAMTKREIQAEAAKLMKEGDLDEMTHHDIAKALRKSLIVTTPGAPPVGADGRLWRYTPGGIYEPLDLEQIGVIAAEQYGDSRFCKRKSDYSGVAKHTYSACVNQTFFDDAPLGLAVGSQFYRLGEQGELTVGALTPECRQRFVVDVEPSFDPPDRWVQFLAQSFAGTDSDSQTLLLQQIMGAILFGLMPKHQIAVLLYGPTNSGKSRVLEMFRRLVPREFRCSVTPYNWDVPKFTATMAGMRLNAVGELDQGHSIPTSVFKSVTGGDSISACIHYQMPFDFVNTAAHVFASNFFIPSKDRTAAFFGRWRIVHFPNTIAEKDINPDLIDQIGAAELDRIVGWAIHGAQSLVRSRGFATSQDHRALIERWSTENSPTLSWLLDDEWVALDPMARELRSGLYPSYTHWCAEAGRKALGKGAFLDELRASAPRFSATEHLLDGKVYYTGLRRLK